MSFSRNANVLPLVANIVSAHASNNSIHQDELSHLIRSVYSALSTAGTVAPLEGEMKRPAVAVNKSVFPDYIVCLEDGKKLKMLKRHLKTSYNLTPDEYRTKWNLPPIYPMVAPSYASHRSTLAKSFGLGKKSSEKVQASSPVVQQVAEGVRGKKRAPSQVGKQIDTQPEE